MDTSTYRKEILGEGSVEQYFQGECKDPDREIKDPLRTELFLYKFKKSSEVNIWVPEADWSGRRDGNPLIDKHPTANSKNSYVGLNNYYGGTFKENLTSLPRFDFKEGVKLIGFKRKGVEDKTPIQSIDIRLGKIPLIQFLDLIEINQNGLLGRVFNPRGGFNPGGPQYLVNALGKKTYFLYDYEILANPGGPPGGPKLPCIGNISDLEPNWEV